MFTGGFFGTYIIAIPILTWIANQAVKILLYGRFRHFRSWRDMFKSGGMPSAHTSFMFALSTALFLKHGPASDILAVALALTAVVMYDAMHVRLESGRHALILNEVYQNQQLSSPSLEKAYPLEVSIGHTMKEVLGGAVFGVFMGCLLMYL